MLHYDLEALRELMRAFYTVSGIRLVLFDADFQYLTGYPEEDCAFCRLMKENAATADRCRQSDNRSLRHCREQEGLQIYRCHAGLLETAVSLRMEDTVVGYLMFGQMADDVNREKTENRLREYALSHGLPDDRIEQGVADIRFCSIGQVKAASKLMEACTSYVLLRELITPEYSRLFDRAKEYIETHLEGECDVETLCRELEISRTKLYEIFARECPVGVAAYIRRRRMHRAKQLLKTTDLPIWEISQRVGFSDYNYFRRVFQKTYGCSPKKIRA